MTNDSDRQLVIVCDVLYPTPHEDSGSLRAVRLLALLQERYHVAFLPAMGPWDGPDADRLRAMSIVVPTSREAQVEFITENRDRIVWVQIARPSAFVYWYPLLAPLGVSAPIVYDSVDAHFVRESREAEALRASGDPRWFSALVGAAATKEHERLVLAHSDVVIAVSENDAAALRTLDPDMRHVSIANITDRFQAPSPDHDGTVVFVGPRVHTPNVGAVEWIVDSIAPAALAAGLPFRFAVIGKGWEDFAARAPSNVSFPGWVDDLAPWYGRALAAVAPLRTGAGVKGKVTEAAAHGCPVVGTEIAFEGMSLASPDEVLRAETTEAFIDALTRLHADPARRAELSANAARVTQATMGRDVAARAVDDIARMVGGLSSGEDEPKVLATYESRK